MSNLIALVLSFLWAWGCTASAALAGARGFTWLALAVLPMLIWSRHAGAARSALTALGCALPVGLLLPVPLMGTLIAAVVLSAAVQGLFRAAPVRGFPSCALLGAVQCALLLAPMLFLCRWAPSTLSAESLGWALMGISVCALAFALVEMRLRRSTALLHMLQRP